MNENTKIAEKEMIRINKNLVDGMNHYRKTLAYMIGDAPVSTLCLDKATERVLLNDGCLRVYDLFDRNLTEIKGLGSVRKRNLTARLNEFLSMC
jgi:hypothetical protein